MNDNPWIVKAPKQHEQVPNGSYMADFLGIEDFTIPSDGSEKWRWEWKIKSGPEKDKTASVLTDKNISPTTLPGNLIAGLLGRSLVAGEDVKASVDACVGKTNLIVVQPGPKGGKPGVRMVSQPPSM